MHEPHGIHDHIETIPFYVETATFPSLLGIFGICEIFHIYRVILYFTYKKIFLNLQFQVYFILMKIWLWIEHRMFWYWNAIKINFISDSKKNNNKRILFTDVELNFRKILYIRDISLHLYIHYMTNDINFFMSLYSFQKFNNSSIRKLQNCDVNSSTVDKKNWEDFNFYTTRTEHFLAELIF